MAGHVKEQFNLLAINFCFEFVMIYYLRFAKECQYISFKFALCLMIVICKYN